MTGKQAVAIADCTHRWVDVGPAIVMKPIATGRGPDRGLSWLRCTHCARLATWWWHTENDGTRTFDGFQLWEGQ
jgi:hypothetical protein